jgi:IS5 family transposase
LGALWIFSAARARVEFGDENVLRTVDALMDWSAISVLRKNGLKRSGRGPQGYKQITLFKCLLIGQWHNLSDPKLEQGLRVRIDFRLVTGLDLQGLIGSDETTHCRFRKALVKAGA